MFVINSSEFQKVKNKISFPFQYLPNSIPSRKYYVWFQMFSIPCFLYTSDSNDKEPACRAVILGLIPGLGRSFGEENGNPLQYSCLENTVDRGAWQAIAHGVTKNWTQLSD